MYHREKNTANWASFCSFVAAMGQNIQLDVHTQRWRYFLAAILFALFAGRAVAVFVEQGLAPEWQVGLGSLLGLAAIATLFATPKRRIVGSVITAGFFSLLIAMVFHWIDHNFEIAQLLEWGIGLVLPVVFYLALYNLSAGSKLILIAKIGIAATFLGHGLYALGLHGSPLEFIEITQRTLHCSAEAANTFLLIMGSVDIVIAIAIFLPKVARIALLYAFVWGTATALARILAVPIEDSFLSHLGGNWQEFLFRVPHGGLPLLLFLTPSAVKLTGAKA